MCLLLLLITGLNLIGKPTFSGRLFSFFSQHPLSHNRDAIIGLIDRVFKLSHLRYHTRNLNIVINILLTNGYSLKFIFDIASRRLRSLINLSLREIIPLIMIPLIMVIIFHMFLLKVFPIFIVPYLSNLSSRISDITKSLNLNAACVGKNKLNIFIKLHKDRLNNSNHLNVVYKLSCNDCNASYVGQTGRQLLTRIKEHRANIRAPSDSFSLFRLIDLMDMNSIGKMFQF